jgi:hypothetical protein
MPRSAQSVCEAQSACPCTNDYDFQIRLCQARSPTFFDRQLNPPDRDPRQMLPMNSLRCAQQMLPMSSCQKNLKTLLDKCAVATRRISFRRISCLRKRDGVLSMSRDLAVAGSDTPSLGGA